MRKSLPILTAALTVALVATALPAGAQSIIDCVSPKGTIDKSTGRLLGKLIDIRSAPKHEAGVVVKVGPATPLGVVEERAGMMKVIGVPDSLFKDGETIGWVRADEVSPQGLRNCH